MPQYHYVRLFPSDYIRDTRFLSQAEHGAYLLLIVEYYLIGGPLPDDDGYLSRTARCESVDEWRAKMRPKMKPFFNVENGYWQHKRCDAEIAEAILSRSYRVAGAEATNAIRRERSALRSACDSATRSALKPELELESESKPKSKPLKSKSKTLPVRDEKAVTDSVPAGVDANSSVNGKPASVAITAVNGKPALQAAKDVNGKPALEAAMNGKPAPKASETWAAYSQGYRERYGQDPVRNKTTNSQMLAFVNRIGVDEAPAVARFYVQQNKAWYVKNVHSVGVMLSSAEGLRTEWASGTCITERQAREADRMQADNEMWGRIEKRQDARRRTVDIQSGD